MVVEVAGKKISPDRDLWTLRTRLGGEVSRVKYERQWRGNLRVDLAEAFEDAE